jgi:hypothetical protein
MKKSSCIAAISAFVVLGSGCKSREFAGNADTQSASSGKVQCQFYCSETPYGSAFSVPREYCSGSLNTLLSSGYAPTDIPRCAGVSLRIVSGSGVGSAGPMIDCAIQCGSDLVQTISVPQLYCSTRNVQNLVNDGYLTSIPRCPNLYIAPAHSSGSSNSGSGTQSESMVDCAVLCNGDLKQEFKAPSQMCKTSKADDLVRTGYLNSLPRCLGLSITLR